MKLRVGLLVFALSGLPALAESDLAAQVSDAAAQIANASERLKSVSDGEGQVIALGQSITAFENGLRVLRDAIRTARVQEAALAQQYEVQRHGLTRMLGTIYTIQSQPSPLLFLHPDGALAAAQSAQMLSEITEIFRANADALGKQAAEIAALKSLKDATTANLQAGLAELLTARAALEDAMAKGAPVPELFVEDRMAVQILAATSENMTAFALALGNLSLPAPGQARQLAFAIGMPLPVAGTLTRGFNEADAAGQSRPGIIVAAAPLALVSAPSPATIRFAGPFLDYGNVVILEPEAGTLLILAGIGRLFRGEGDILTMGDPIGLLGGSEATSEEYLIDSAQETGVQQQQTLYIELRRNGESVDPAPWFVLEQAGSAL